MQPDHSGGPPTLVECRGRRPYFKDIELSKRHPVFLGSLIEPPFQDYPMFLFAIEWHDDEDNLDTFYIFAPTAKAAAQFAMEDLLADSLYDPEDLLEWFQRDREGFSVIRLPAPAGAETRYAPLPPRDTFLYA